MQATPRPLISRNSTIAGALCGWNERALKMATGTPWIHAPERWWRDDGTSHELEWRGTVQPKTAGRASEKVSNTQNDVGHDLISSAQESSAQLRPELRRSSQPHQIQQHRISSQRQWQHRQVESTRTRRSQRTLSWQ